MLSTAISVFLAIATAPTPTTIPGKAPAADTIEPRLMRNPDIHGDTVVFSYAGDLWVAKTDPNAVALRLTSHPGIESYPHISPDGQWVAFTGQYDGSPNVYIMPITGGEPKRLTYSTEGDVCLGWTPDGKIYYGSSSGNVVPDQASLYIIDPAGGIPTPTPIKEVASGKFFADGHRFAYTRTPSFRFNWRKYRGGTQGRVAIYDMLTNSYSELPSGREQSFHPMPVGEDIYYISDRGTGTLNLFMHHGDKEEKLTDFKDTDIRFPSTDDKSVVFENDGYLYDFDIASRKLAKLSPRIVSDDLSARPSLKNLTPYITGLTLSPSGSRIAVAARGQIFSIPAHAGETRNYTKSSAIREQSPIWSPDGKTIAYLSDKSGEWEIYTRPQGGGEATPITSGAKDKFIGMQWFPDNKSLLVTNSDNELKILDLTTKQFTTVDKAPYGFGGTDIAPNSQWIAYVKADHVAGAHVYLYDVKSAKSIQVTKSIYAETDVAFDYNLNFLYVVSQRTFTPTPGIFEASLKIDEAAKLYAIPLNPKVANPFAEKDEEEGAAKPDAKPTPPSIDLTGADQRTIELPLPVGSYANLVGAQGGFFIYNHGALLRYDMGAPGAQPVYVGLPAPAYVFNPARTKVAVVAPGKIQVLDVQPGLNPGAPGVDLSNVEAIVDPKAEWKDIFWDSWRYIRDNYYDPKIRNLDWLAIGKRYEGYLPYVEHRNDLNYIIGLMLGELGTGHAYIETPGDFNIGARPVPVGYLGANYTVDGDKVKITKIFNAHQDDSRYASPLGKYGLDVKEGDYLISIDGQAVNSKVNPASLLVGKVGKVVSVVVSSLPSGDKPRTLRVRPVPTESDIRYADWVDRMRTKVTELSGGQIGYMHIRDTAAQGSHDFVEGFYSLFDKPALLIDERWNHGGYPQPWFANTLARQPMGFGQQRGINDSPEAPAHEGPKALLINQYAGSGGDFFPYMFRKNGLGPLIGKRTWGGLVGIDGGYQLVDGGSITAPKFSLFNPDTNEIIAENHGIDPDIDVDLRPDLLAKGMDPQIEAAVKYLMEELKKHPVRKPRKEIPHVGKQGLIEKNP